MAGIFVAECVHRRYKCMEKVHWRQLIILAEIVLLFLSASCRRSQHLCKRARLVRLRDAGADLPQGARPRLREHHVHRLFMRSGTEALCVYFHTHDREVLKKALTYFGVIGIFAVGAGLGSVLTARFAEKVSGCPACCSQSAF